VLQEFYVKVTAKKIPKPLSPAEAREVISPYRAWPIVAPSADSILRAFEVQERHNLSFWEALIVVDAASAGAASLFSEDLNHGQAIERRNHHQSVSDQVHLTRNLRLRRHHGAPESALAAVLALQSHGIRNVRDNRAKVAD
jgi:hypothetical protein